MNFPSNPKVIRSDDSNAVAQIQEKIAAAEKLQATMKAANQIVRNPKLSDDEKVAQLSAQCELRESSARQLLKPDFAGRIGFPDYQLTNNNANIRRMHQRLKGLVDEGGRESVTLTFPGGRVEDNAEEHRVRIYHDARPPAETIAKLRTYGFHWTPSLGCWQRLRNNSARYAAEQITGVQLRNAMPRGTGEAIRPDGPTVATRPATAVGVVVRTGIAA
jgi:hypothetical protein